GYPFEADPQPGALPLLCNHTLRDFPDFPAGRARWPTIFGQLREYCPEVANERLRTLWRAACGGSCGHPAHRANAGASDLQLAVVTARAEVPTADGTRLTRLARVTLDPAGDIRKLV